MSSEKFKIGTNLTVEKDYQLKGFFDDEDVLKVKKGDRILVTKTGFNYITGDARGNMTLSENLIDKTQYDIDNITLRVTDAIISFLGEDFEEFMEWHAIKKKDLLNEIQEELDYFI